MKTEESTDSSGKRSQPYVLRLYVAGGEPNSRLARANLTRICKEHLEDRYQIEEIDVLNDFARALIDRIFVTPTLVLIAPEPKATVVGNLGDEGSVISALRLRLSHES